MKTNVIYNDDAQNILAQLDNNSIDMVLTDPPYFLDKLDNKWDTNNVNSKKNQKVITSLPAGMRFNREQGVQLYNWYKRISIEIFRILKPGGFFFSFSSPRLYHRVASAVDDAGFEIRDMFIWLYTRNQMKAMSLHHFVDKMKKSDKEKKIIKSQIDKLKTPQVKSCFEPIVMAQKPTDGTYLNNFLYYQTGLINTDVKQGIDSNYCVANVMSNDYIDETIDKFFLVEKPNKKEKGKNNTHKTVKPLAICSFIINVFSTDNAIVLDPFSGSGTTLLAAKQNNRRYIGIEINKEYVDIIKSRLEYDT